MIVKKKNYFCRKFQHKTMKTKFITLIIVMAFTFTGCKNEKSVDSLDVVTPEVVDNTFKVTVKTIVKKDDDFSLYYTEDGSTDFKIAPIWMAVKGSSNEQDVVFTLPEDVIPTQVRLDFGMKQDQEDIIFKGFKFEYQGKSFEKSGPELAIYFTPDLTKCTFDATTGTIKAVVKNGKKEFPSLYPNATPIQTEIAKLVK